MLGLTDRTDLKGGMEMEPDFASVCGEYYDRVYRFLLALSGDPHQAEDLTQEVFYRALLHIGRYEERGQMFTWLCAIGKNLWLSQRGKRKHHEPLSPALAAPGGPEEDLSRQEDRAALRRAVAALPEDYRDVVILHIYGEIPLKEISALKGKSVSWGKVTYYRARQMLRQKLEGLL